MHSVHSVLCLWVCLASSGSTRRLLSSVGVLTGARETISNPEFQTQSERLGENLKACDLFAGFLDPAICVRNGAASKSLQTFLLTLRGLRAPRLSASIAPVAMKLPLRAGSTSGCRAVRGATMVAGATSGLTAALLSPLASALGFMIWADNWRGSAFALNLVKNTFAASLFALVLLITSSFPNLSAGVLLSPLAFSALLGVVIGDSTAIAALKRLGSRRYLLIDCIKPALAAIVGIVFLEESLTLRSAAGIFAVIVGVGVASTVDDGTDSVDSGPARTNRNSILLGYALAIAHILLDTAGASITKQHCQGLGPFAIGLIRFGSAAIMLALIGISGRFASALLPSSERRKASSSDNVIPSQSRPLAGWWSLPSKQLMKIENWRGIFLGTVFVTFLGPSLFLRSLLLMPFGVSATLSCIGPLYEPFLAKVLRDTKPNPLAIAGATMAFVGVGLLCM